MQETNGIELNIDKDYYCDNPKFQCLVAEVNKEPVGIILYLALTFSGGELIEHIGFALRKKIVINNITIFLLSKSNFFLHLIYFIHQLFLKLCFPNFLLASILFLHLYSIFLILFQNFYFSIL